MITRKLVANACSVEEWSGSTLDKTVSLFLHKMRWIDTLFQKEFPVHIDDEPSDENAIKGIVPGYPRGGLVCGSRQRIA